MAIQVSSVYSVYSVVSKKIDQVEFRQWLDEAVREIGAHSAACIRMDNPVLRERIGEYRQNTEAWLEEGLHGEMDYLERMFPDKADPWKTFPFAKSVIVVAFTNEWGYQDAGHPFPEPAPDALTGYISAYAKRVDYHSTGQRILAGLHRMLGEEVQAEVTVDTKAVDERLFASVGGLGVYGANTLLRLPDRTNVRTFIGCLFVDQELPEVIHEPAMPFGCADCQACVRNCPTGAIRPGQPMDARKCISYLTIEKRGLLSSTEGAMMGDWIFGCDDCTTVCPPKDKVDTRIPVDLEWLIKCSSGELRRTIKGNAAAYAGVTQLRKNAAVVLKNMQSPRADELLDWLRNSTGSDLIRAQIDLW